MKSTIICLLFVIACFGQLIAQENKTTIAVMDFTEAAGQASQGHVAQVQEMLIKALVQTKRFHVVQGENELATYNIYGTILACEVSDKMAENGDTYYKANFKFNLKIKETATGNITVSENFGAKSKSVWASEGSKVLNTFGFNKVSSKTDVASGMIGSRTEAEAVNEALKTARRSIDRFIAKNFPITAQIVEMTKKKSRSAINVLILTGEESGFEKGNKLKVIQITTKQIGGKIYTRKKEIGIIKIKAIEGDFADCTVKKGGAAILKGFEREAKLLCVLVR